jgi:hypothetical protein
MIFLHTSKLMAAGEGDHAHDPGNKRKQFSTAVRSALSKAFKGIGPDSPCKILRDSKKQAKDYPTLTGEEVVALIWEVIEAIDILAMEAEEHPGPEEMAEMIWWWWRCLDRCYSIILFDERFATASPYALALAFHQVQPFSIEVVCLTMENILREVIVSLCEVKDPRPYETRREELLKILPRYLQRKLGPLCVPRHSSL